MPATNSPVAFKFFQMVMNHLGYGIIKHDHPNSKIIWQQNGSRKREHDHLPAVVTTLRPDFTAAGYDQTVYERQYMVDFLSNIFGDDSPDSGLRIRAILLSAERDDNEPC